MLQSARNLSLVQVQTLKICILRQHLSGSGGRCKRKLDQRAPGNILTPWGVTQSYSPMPRHLLMSRSAPISAIMPPYGPGAPPMCTERRLEGVGEGTGLSRGNKMSDEQRTNPAPILSIYIEMHPEH